MIEFKSAVLSRYRYDPARDCVVSTWKGANKWCPMKWQYSGGVPYVVLTSTNRRKYRYTRQQVMDLLRTNPTSDSLRQGTSVSRKEAARAKEGWNEADQKAAREAAASYQNALAAVTPPGDFLVYSVVQKASQYCARGTTIADAIALLKRRGLDVSINTVRFVDAHTGKPFAVKEVTQPQYTIAFD